MDDETTQLLMGEKALAHWHHLAMQRAKILNRIDTLERAYRATASGCPDAGLRLSLAERSMVEIREALRCPW